ncbi:hypothetical protein Tco_0003154 [Tanacetum coccineum]
MCPSFLPLSSSPPKNSPLPKSDYNQEMVDGYILPINLIFTQPTHAKKGPYIDLETWFVNNGSIAMVGRATEVASLLNQGNGPDVSSNFNLYDRRHLHVLELKVEIQGFPVLMPICTYIAEFC